MNGKPKADLMTALKALFVTAAICLSACERSSPPPPPAPTVSAAAIGPSSGTVSDNDLGRVCRGAIAALNGRDPRIIKVETLSAGVAHVVYRRPDDGTLWKNQCRIDGARVAWAAVDLSGPDSGPGRWRIDPDDEIVTFELAGPTVKIRIAYSDGSASEETYEIS